MLLSVGWFPIVGAMLGVFVSLGLNKHNNQPIRLQSLFGSKVDLRKSINLPVIASALALSILCNDSHLTFVDNCSSSSQKKTIFNHCADDWKSHVDPEKNQHKINNSPF